MQTVKIDLSGLGLNLSEMEMLKISSLGFPVQEYKLYDNNALIRHCKKFYKNNKTGEIKTFDEVTKKFIDIQLD